MVPQAGALPLEGVMVLAGVVLLEREGLSNFKLFSFASQSHRRHEGSVSKLPASPFMEERKASIKKN